VLIAEDDPAMRQVLKKTLAKIPGVKVIGEAGDGATALKMVEDVNPRVVFIDIDLPGKNGVELAREICNVDPQAILIFATAYDDYTHEAFEVYAFDYLVKPFKLQRIKKTMERIIKLESQKSTVSEKYNAAVKGEVTPPRLVIRQHEKLVFLDAQEIIFITKENRKTVIITPKQKFSITENLNHLEQRLTGNSFFRSHRGYIINLRMIREIFPWGKNGYQVSFAGTKQTALLARDKARELEKILAIPKS
jgi:two-component system LytT family response regulator